MDLQGSQLARAQSRHIGLGFSNWNIRLQIRFWQTSNLTRTNPFKRCGGIVPDLNECFNREAFKYCLADFVRQRGNSPFRTFFYLKNVADFSPFTESPPIWPQKNFTNIKNTCFLKTDLGAPGRVLPFTDNIFGKQLLADSGDTPTFPIYEQNPPSSIWKLP